MSSLQSEISGVFRTQVGTGATAVVIDVLDAQTYTTASRATQHAVEDGTTISDHIIDEPDALQLVAFFAQSLDDAEEQLRASETRAQDTYQKLLELKASKERHTVFTSSREFENMVIERVTEPRTRSDGVTVTIDLKEIKTATSEVVEAPATRAEKNPKRKKGKKPKQPTNEAQNISAAKKIANWF